MRTSLESSKKPQPLQLTEERFRLLVEGVTDYAIILLDPRGLVSSWNRGAEAITGYSAEEITGCHFACFYPKESVELGWPEHELMVAKVDGRFQDEGWRLRKDGSRFWASVHVTALFDDRGDLWGYSKITHDLTERRAYEDRLRQSEERFRLLVEGVRDSAIFLLTPQGIVNSWNAGAERIKGYSAHEIVGHSFSRFYTEEARAAERPQQVLTIARREGCFEEEGWRVRKNGERFWASVRVTALYDDAGRLHGFAKVTRDLSERKRIEALELAEQRTNEFLAMLSHELRNPLAPMRSALGVMDAAPADDPVQEESRQVIERQVSHIARVVDDLLDVSRVTAGTINLVREPVDLVEVIGRALESSVPLLEERNHRLERHLPDRPVVVEGDMVRLTQVIANLLNNAAQYTAPGGLVSVHLEAAAERARLTVKDTGQGIAPHLLSDVFGVFVQGERHLDRSEGGLGIGLTLARRLVELHGGVICAASEGIDKGSAFTIELPLLEAGCGERSRPAESSKAAQARGSSQRRILLVEDMPDVAEGMEMILNLWGHQVEVVHDGAEALERVRQFSPDVVLLDIGLPGMSGYEVAENLREMPEADHVLLIALTGYGQKRDRDRALAAGFDHHLVKGDSLDDLESLLQKHRRPADGAAG